MGPTSYRQSSGPCPLCPGSAEVCQGREGETVLLGHLMTLLAPEPGIPLGVAGSRSFDAVRTHMVGSDGTPPSHRSLPAPVPISFVLLLRLEITFPDQSHPLLLTPDATPGTSLIGSFCAVTCATFLSHLRKEKKASCPHLLPCHCPIFLLCLL